MSEMNTQTNVKVSIVMPVFNAESYIGECVRSRIDTLDELDIKYELIVILDGRSDKSISELEKIQSDNLSVFQYENNQGKGFALKYGMVKAKGEYIGFIDAGKDIPGENLKNIINEMIKNPCDAIIGSKWADGSKIKYTLYRRVVSRAYNYFVRILLGLPHKDTQVGIKIFSSELLNKVLPNLLVKRFAFDVELLSVSRRYGFEDVRELPVSLNEDGLSTVGFSDGLKSFWDILAIFYRINIKHYYDSDRFEIKNTDTPTFNHLKNIKG